MRGMKNYITGRPKRFASLVAIFCVIAFGAESCDDPSPSGQQAENKSRQSGYEKLVKTQPAHSMDFSPTRETKNFWIDTWDEKGKLSYVYLMNGQGEVFGYFIFEGLPVSYCVSLIPPYQLLDPSGDGVTANLPVPGPSIDGTFSSSSNCNAFYGKDAVSGSYVEYTVGLGINALLFDQPLPQYGDAEPLGNATVQGVKQK